jgi:hypothetical protein
MPWRSYRRLAERIGPDDHFKSVKVVECDSDEEALTAADKMIGQFSAMEVWKLGKFIGRVGTPAPEAVTEEGRRVPQEGPRRPARPRVISKSRSLPPTPVAARGFPSTHGTVREPARPSPN